MPEGKDSSSQWIFPEHLLAVLSSSAEDCSRRKDCFGSDKEQAGHCQPPGAHCIALSLVRCVGGEGESKGGDEEICGGVPPLVQAAEWWTLPGSPTLLWEGAGSGCFGCVRPAPSPGKPN